MERNSDLAKSIITFYNNRTLCTIRSASEGNQELVFTALDTLNGNVVALKEHIKSWLENNPIDDYPSDTARFKACFTEVTPASGTNNETGCNATVATSLSIISNAVTEAIKSTSIKMIETDIMGSVQEEIRKFIKSEYGTIERKITTIVDGVKHEGKGFVHEKFDTVVKFVANNQAVYLVGPAGSGKNVLCKQVADALGLKFYFSNAVTQEYKLTGFTDAMGNYQPTQFYKAFTEGGLFMLDEIDASIPEVLTILNAAIANKYFDFPAPIGYKEAHPNFRVVAAGNTTGHGADYQYVGRNQLDGASLDRFRLIPIEYSSTVEDNIAGDVNLANFCREFRAAAKKAGVNIIVSYRAIEGLATMLPLLSMEEALQTCLVKDLEKDDLRIITKELSNTKYKTALEHIYSGM